MNGFEMWKQDKNNMKYQTPDFTIMLMVKPEVQSLSCNSRPDKGKYEWISWSVNRVYVIMGENPKEYCGEVKILEKSEFGEYSEESYQEAVTHFKTLVSNLL